MKPISVVLGSLICLSTYGQGRFETITERNAWLTSSNAAALASYSDSTISKAELTYCHTSGPWHGFSDASHKNDITADVRSYFRLSPRLMAAGGITYRNISGKVMQGSMLYDDGMLKPFDIVDDSLTNAGDKHTEMISLAGAIAWTVSKHLALGGKVDYDAGTYVKYKDLRHTNTCMRFNATAGIFMPGLIDNLFDLGINASYKRQTESIEFKTYGTNDKTYKSLIDYANMMGTVETFGAEGFTEGGAEQPLFTENVGLAIQACVHLSSAIDWFNEYAWQSKNGFYGKKSQYSICHAQWDGSDQMLRSRLVWTKASSMHYLEFILNSQNISAERNVYSQEKGKDNASLTYYEYYTPVKMNDKVITNMHIAYTGHFNAVDEYYLWRISTGIDITKRDQTAYLFPYYRKQSVSIYRPFISAERRFMIGRQQQIFANIGIATQHGVGDIYTDGILSDIIHEEKRPATQNDYLTQEYEFLTVRQWLCHIAVGYHFRLRNVPKIRPVVSLAYDMRRANTHTCLEGCMRQSMSLRLGCEF